MLSTRALVWRNASSVRNKMRVPTTSNGPKRLYVMPSFEASGKDKVAIIGSGSFGSAMARVVGENCRKYSFTEDIVKMYCFEEVGTL